RGLPAGALLVKGAKERGGARRPRPWRCYKPKLPAEGEAEPATHLAFVAEAVAEPGIDCDVVADQRVEVQRAGPCAVIEADVAGQVKGFVGECGCPPPG